MEYYEGTKGRIEAALGKKKAETVLKNADILNVFTGEMEHGDLAVSDGFIVGIGEYCGENEIDASGKTIVPGFIDSHMHLESSIVTPRQYSVAAAAHGTSAVVADPHEIANVCGTAGIDYILKATENLPISVYIMVPSCVPATPFDESGYKIGEEEIKRYLKHDRVLGLAELMNYPGVFACDTEVIGKINITNRENKLIDGHAPFVSGKQLNAYSCAGVYSDHECTNAGEALEKLRRGQWIMIREGTACKNLKPLVSLCREPYFGRCLFATDDKHPGDLASEGHIDYIIRKAISLGVKPDIAYRIATINAAMYFGLTRVGAVCPGYRADFVVLSDYENVSIDLVFKNGCLAAKRTADGSCVEIISGIVDSDCTADDNPGDLICDTVHINEVDERSFVLNKEAEVIGLVSGEILTTDEGKAGSVDISGDICKLAVMERHHNTGHTGLCYLKGYGIKEGAVATSIAHDSHNIICAGVNDRDMAVAVNYLREMKGGMVVVKNGKPEAGLPLPIAGLMCNLPVREAQEKMDFVKQKAHELGIGKDIDPFMTLSFASLPVIPALRLTTLGVVKVVSDGMHLMTP